MKTFNGKPLYDIVADPKSEESGTNRIDFVSKPANKMPLLKFSDVEDQKVKLEFSKERRLVTAVIMQPDFPMLREKNGEQFYVQFPAPTIEFMRDKFMMLMKLHERGTEHAEELDDMDAPLVETWIVDKSRGISAPEELAAPDGSWIGTFRVINDDVWNKVEDGTFSGVSLEGIFDLYETFSSIDNKVDERLNNLFRITILNRDLSVVDKFNALKALCVETEK